MLDRYFNPNRFFKALRYDLILNVKSYFSLGIGLILGLVLIDFFFILKTGRVFDDNDYLSLFYLTFVISGILVIGTSFPFLRNKKSLAAYLMLPASIFEKFLIQLMIRVVFFIPFYLVLFWLDFKIAGAIYNVFSWRNGTMIQSFSILASFRDFPYNTALDVVAIVGAVFTVCMFLFAGSTYFKKHTIFKTILSFSALVGLIVLMFWVLTLIFYPDLNDSVGSFIYLEVYKISEFLVNVQLFAYIIAIVSGLFLLPLAYFKLKEKQL